MKNKKKYVYKLVLLFDVLVIFTILCLIKNNPHTAESYTNNVANKYITFASKIFSNIPFSVYEFTLIFLIGMVIFYIISIIVKLCKKKYIASLQRFISSLLFVFICVDIYVGVASISYGRNQVSIPQYNQEINNELIDQTFEYFLEDYNNISTHFSRDENGLVISPYTFEEINNILIEEYKKLDENYFPSFTPKAKKLLFSDIFSELHFTGIFWAPTGEANINNNLHAAELPHTMAHEIAHSKGVFRENDANLVAMYVTLNSENEFLRYSAYYHNFSSLLRIYQQTNYDKYVESYFRLNEDIRKEYGVINNYWKEHDLLSKIGQLYNDIFLKLNGNKNGVNDYNDNTTSEDSGKVDENNNPIYVIKEYSPYAKLFFYLYQEANYDTTTF